MKSVNNIRVLISIMLIITVGLALTPVNRTNKSENGNGEFIDTTSTDLFELIFNEAKLFYVDALVSAYFNDTSETKYCFDRVFEIVAQISGLDSLTLLQQDDFNRFNEKVTSDYQTNFVYLIENPDSLNSTDSGPELYEIVLDSVDIGNDTLIIIEDRPGHIPLIRSDKVDRLIKYYSTQQKDRLQRFLESSNKYREHILPILKQYGVPEEIFYLPLIESGFNPNAYSYAHAAGMWQFIAGTGARYGLKRNWWVDERRDPIKSTHAAAKYLKKLYDEFGDWYLALAAYNTGEMRVWRAIKREGTRDYWKLCSLPSQTRNYVPSFMAATIIAKNPEKYGFKTPTEPTWKWDEITVDRCYEFEDIARAAKITSETLRSYNPELRRWMTPSNDNQYTLRLPIGTSEGLSERLAALPEAKDVEPEMIYHKVRRGENLSSIAHRYGTSVSALVAANHLRNRNNLRVGQRLLVPTSKYYSTPEKITAETNLIIHVVKSGETLSEIAESYHTSLSKIRSLNNIYQDNIKVGMKLKIPTNLTSQKTPSDTPKGSEKVVHIVKRGETLTSIANRYHVSLVKVKSWNDLDGRKPIYPGQRIIIYKSIQG